MVQVEQQVQELGQRSTTDKWKDRDLRTCLCKPLWGRFDNKLDDRLAYKLQE